MASYSDIKKLLDEISSFIGKYQSLQEIPTIERDIILQKLRSAYDSLCFPANTTCEQITQPTPTVSVVEQPTVVEKPVVEEPQVHIQPENTAVKIETPIQQEPRETPQDIFAAKPRADLNSVLGKKPISDIMSAIGPNDRIRFRAALFSKNQELFENTVTLLNHLNSYEEAVSYLKNTFDLDYESSDVTDFLAIVERRYL
ncbi:MAG: hypothetical protein IKP99_01780 [Bacteroidales bacterium]|nr:hypothetical protein [Bacteroidales bacterium]MBR6266390.1 hypothetical protein [Bacteroidales bacterium]